MPLYLPPATGGGNSTSSTAYGSEPGSPATGDVDFYSGGLSIARYNGSAWDRFGPVAPLTPPPLATNWTWVNQGSSTVADAGGTLVLQAASAASDTWRALVRSAPTPPYTLTAWVRQGQFGSTNEIAVCWRQSSDGKLILMRLYRTSGWYLSKYDSPTGFNAHYTNGTTMDNSRPICLRLTDDNTNRITSWSPDGLTFFQLHSVGRTNYLTADQIGFAVNHSTTGETPVGQLLSWKVS